MSKLEGSSALARRKESQRPDRITTVGSRRNVTTGTSPTPIRLTPDERAELNLWVEELQGLTKKKELLSNVVYGVGQAAFLSDSSSTCTPSLNFTLFTTNVSSANPLSRFHFFFATSSSL